MPKQAVAVELFYDGAWHDLVIDDDVLAAPVVIKRGQSDEGSAFRPCSVTCTLANDDDRYRTTNPNSPLYGKAGRNTPMRVSVGSSVRATAEALSWRATQSRDFRQTPRRGSASVDLEGGGLLARLGQWKEPLRSPFYRFNSRLSSVGYFPLEQKVGATIVETPTAGAVGGKVKNLAFEGQYRPAGSGLLPDVDTAPVSTTSMFVTGSATSATGWQVSWVQKLTAFDPAETYNFFFWKTWNGVYWAMSFSAGNWLLTGSDDAGTISVSKVVPTTYDLAGAGWMMFCVEATYSGGTTTVRFSYRGEDSTVGFVGHSDTYAGVPGDLKSWSVTGMSLTDFSVGHVLGVNVPSTTTDLIGADRWDAFTGYVGEPALFRFSRLCGEEGIPFDMSTGFDESAPMGVQAQDTITNLLQEIAATEDALLFDSIDAVEIYLLGRTVRYRQTPALTLSPTDLTALPPEVTDDLDIHNVVTVSQRDGGDYTARDDTSSMGTATPPDGVGEYRQTVDVCLSNEAWLPFFASWWLKRGTVELPRFPQVVVDLAAAPHLVPAVEAVDIGDVIEIIDMRQYTIRLYVLGYTEKITQHGRTVTFTCAPDQQFQPGRWDSTDSRWDSQSTTLKTAVSPSATSVTFRTVNPGDRWDTTATPYDVVIGGQQNTVTSMGAASLVSGAYDQVATLARGVDGINKGLAAGEPIHVATPGRWAL